MTQPHRSQGWCSCHRCVPAAAMAANRAAPRSGSGRRVLLLCGPRWADPPAGPPSGRGLCHPSRDRASWETAGNQPPQLQGLLGVQERWESACAGTSLDGDGGTLGEEVPGPSGRELVQGRNPGESPSGLCSSPFARYPGFQEPSAGDGPSVSGFQRNGFQQQVRCQKGEPVHTHATEGTCQHCLPAASRSPGTTAGTHGSPRGPRGRPRAPAAGAWETLPLCPAWVSLRHHPGGALAASRATTPSRQGPAAPLRPAGPAPGLDKAGGPTAARTACPRRGRRDTGSACPVASTQVGGYGSSSHLKRDSTVPPSPTN